MNDPIDLSDVADADGLPPGSTGWPDMRPERTPEERADFEARLEAAKAKFRAAALAEPDEVGAGWRPWMGPRPEPTPEERAAHEAAWAAWRERVREKALAGDYDEPPVGMLAVSVPYNTVPPADRNVAAAHPAPADSPATSSAIPG